MEDAAFNTALLSLKYYSYFAEHSKNARPSTKGKHEKGQGRKLKDRDGEKGERNPPRVRPPNWKGPWPPPK